MCGRWILGKRCTADHIRGEDGKVLLYVTDQNLDTSNWVQILMVARGCTILTQMDFLELNRDHRVFMEWPEFGAATTRYQHQLSEYCWVVNEVLLDDGPLHMIDQYVIPVPR